MAFRGGTLLLDVLHFILVHFRHFLVIEAQSMGWVGNLHKGGEILASKGHAFSIQMPTFTEVKMIQLP